MSTYNPTKVSSMTGSVLRRSLKILGPLSTNPKAEGVASPKIKLVHFSVIPFNGLVNQRYLFPVELHP